MQSLLRLDLGEPHGLASLVAFAAVAPVLWTGFRNCRTRTRRLVTIGVAALVLVGVGLGVAQGIAVLQARSSVATGIDAARSGLRSRSLR